MAALVGELSREVLVSVDTYKVAVAEAAVAAGAGIVNDVSGLRDPGLAEVCARSGAALVLMHTAVEPKGTLLDPGTYEDVVGVGRRVPALARVGSRAASGVAEEQLILDPGPDFAKTPAQTVAVLRRLDALRAFGRPALAGRLAQGLRRGDHRTGAGASAIRGRWRRSATASTRAPRSCACTTSRAPRTTSRCAPSCAASACWARWRACRPSVTPTASHRTSR